MRSGGDLEDRSVDDSRSNYFSLQIPIFACHMVGGVEAGLRLSRGSLRPTYRLGTLVAIPLNAASAEGDTEHRTMHDPALLSPLCSLDIFAVLFVHRTFQWKDKNDREQ